MRLDLQRRRGAGDIVGDALRLFFGYAPVFFTATLIVVAPVTILVDGVLGGEFTAGSRAHPSGVVLVLSGLLGGIAIPTLVTSLHVRAIQGLAEGDEPTVTGVLRQALAIAPWVLPVLALYLLGIVLGFAALFIPGLYLSVRWYFAAQAVVVDRHRGRDALRASGHLVAGSWWRVFWTTVLLTIVAEIIGSVIGAVLGLGLRAVTDSGAAHVAVQTFSRTIALSITALGGTLMFFSLRREKGLTEEPLRGFLPPTDAFGAPQP